MPTRRQELRLLRARQRQGALDRRKQLDRARNRTRSTGRGNQQNRPLGATTRTTLHDLNQRATNKLTVEAEEAPYAYLRAAGEKLGEVLGKEIVEQPDDSAAGRFHGFLTKNEWGKRLATGVQTFAPAVAGVIAGLLTGEKDLAKGLAESVADTLQGLQDGVENAEANEIAALEKAVQAKFEAIEAALAHREDIVEQGKHARHERPRDTGVTLDRGKLAATNAPPGQRRGRLRS